jgi:hypothetical protein
MATLSKHHGSVFWAVLTCSTVTMFVSGPARGREQASDVRAHVSACGRHKLEVASGAVLVDGRRVNPSAKLVDVLAPPTCRSDGRAVAWLERDDGETRLVVIPEMEARTDALPWRLPFVGNNDRVFWATRTRVVVGPSLLAPRVVASWTERLR